MTLRLGEILVQQNVLSDQQLEAILAEQERGGGPFGLLAEQLFGVDPETIENAWAEQYTRIARTVDPAGEAFEQPAIDLVSRRQAWQFRVLPIRFEDGVLMIATMPDALRRALRFATRVIDVPCYFVMAEPDQLGLALCKHYPLPGLTPLCVRDQGLDRLLGLSGDRSQQSEVA